MKTPMQEMIDEMNKILREEKECFILDLRDKARELLQKEKEAIMDAYDYGFSDAKSNHDHNKRILQRNL